MSPRDTSKRVTGEGVPRPQFSRGGGGFGGRRQQPDTRPPRATMALIDQAPGGFLGTTLEAEASREDH